MATGWQQVGGDWYYFYSDGTMATGWINDGTGWYYLYGDGNGSMAWGTTIDGYNLNASGEWVSNGDETDEWTGDTKLQDLFAATEGAWKDSNATGFALAQQYYLAWYYGTNAEERSNVNMSASSYVVYDLFIRESHGEDISTLTVSDIDNMCNNIGNTQDLGEMAIGANVDKDDFINKEYSVSSNKGAGEAVKLPDATFTAKKLQHELKHSGDFGVTGNWNKATGEAYQKAIQNHIDTATDVYKSTYRGDDVYVYINKNTGVGAYTDLSGNYVGGWKFSSDQMNFHLTNGTKIK